MRKRQTDAEPDPSRNLQKKLGLTSYFCPVTLHEHEVLRAGDPDIAAVYRNLLPPPRIVVIGPTGTGKSLHSRQIALNLNLVHIDFSSLLQEIIFPKFGRKIGKQYVDHEPIPDVVLPP
ncbi:unnamed protein product [Trichobilharzia regenti]|nr:unnamed protein product [Trichobilharzia regenti]